MTDPKKKFAKIAEGFRNAMLVSIDDAGGLHARPMHIAKFEDSGEIWFVTSRTAEKTKDIDRDLRCCVTMQGGGHYVSISGIAELREDRSRARELWSESLRPWFPGGSEDPLLVLVRVVPEEAEYWDQTGMRGVRYLFEAAKAVIQGRRLDEDDPSKHAAIHM